MAWEKVDALMVKKTRTRAIGIVLVFLIAIQTLLAWLLGRESEVVRFMYSMHLIPEIEWSPAAALFTAVILSPLSIVIAYVLVNRFKLGDVFFTELSNKPVLLMSVCSLFVLVLSMLFFLAVVLQL